MYINIEYFIKLIEVSLVAQRVKMDSIPGLGRSPGGRAWQPTAEFLPGESQGQRSLVSYSL